MRHISVAVLLISGLAVGVSDASVIVFDNPAGEFVWGRETSDGDIGTPHLDIFQPASQSGLVRTATTLNIYQYIPDNEIDYGYTDVEGGTDSVGILGDNQIFAHYFGKRPFGFSVARASSLRPGQTVGPSNSFQESPSLSLDLRRTPNGPLEHTSLFPRDGYLGICIDRDGPTIFGWVHLINEQPVAWAYESEIGVGIEIPNVPAPGGVMPLAASVLAARRRRR